MKGYKGTDKDMRCRGMQYEIGKTFYADGKIEVCDNGLHFCIRLTDVFDYYVHGNGNRFFEVEADGIIDSDGKKSAASELKIIRELTDIEINRTVYGDGNGYGYGYGYSNGDGYGYGYSNGYGYGYSNGDGYGDGYCYGYRNGYGNGDGYGNIQKVLMYI